MSDALGADTPAPGDSTPGAILKRERERRATSVQQVAEDLHLDIWMVEAIEANRFLALGAPVYARGHLRKYATHLGLQAEEIIQRYERLQDRPVETDPIPAALVDPIRPPRRPLKGPVWVIAGLIALALLAWGVLELLSVERIVFLTDRQTTGSSEPAVAREPRAEAEQSATPDVETTTAPVAAAAPVSAEPAASSAETSGRPGETVSAAKEAIAAEPVQLRLEFSGESWTEIYDANGTRLMYGMGAPGRVRTLSGVPPLQVTFGSVSAVTMEVNGERVAIPRREGREASRFVVEPDGDLR